jgi:hypothetical protein
MTPPIIADLRTQRLLEYGVIDLGLIRRKFCGCLKPSPTVAAAAPTTAAMSAAFLARRHRSSFGDSHISAAVFSSVEFLNRIRSFLIRGHLNEAKALAAAGISIGDNFGGLNASGLSEDLLQ